MKRRISLSLLLALIACEVLYAQQWSGSADVNSLIYRNGNIRANGLQLGRYGSSVNGDPNPYTIYSDDNQSHDLLLFGSNAGTLHMHLYDGDLKLGSSTTPNTILYSNGAASFGGTVTVKGNLNLAGVAGRRLFMGGVSGATYGLAYDEINPNFGIFYTEGSPDYVSISPNGNANTGTMNIYGNGKVGIGTAGPGAALDVVGPSAGTGPTIKASGGGDIVMNSGGSLFFDGNYSYASGNYIRPLASNTQAFFTSGAERMRISSSGNVGIGTTNPNEKLTVNGTIYGKEVKVDLSVPGPDYVFEKDYDLPSLEEIKSYIDEHKHLPEVPSAKEMEKNGIDVGEMNMILLKKVEELTLYMIELKGENTNAKKEIEILKNEVSRLKEKK